MENPKPEIACMKKLAPFGQANPKAKWWRLQQPNNTLNLLSEAFQSHHFMENPKPEIAWMKDVTSFGQENQNQNDENSNNPQQKKTHTKLL
jgi:hypothetical protein